VSGGGASRPAPAFPLAPGFRSGAAACGLKVSGAPDVALVVSDGPASAAGVFTTNRVPAAPVLVDRERLAAGAARIRAVVANAGCANACTGEQGMEDAQTMARLAAEAVGCAPEQLLVLSTGVIGVPLDMAKLARGIAAAAAKLSDDASAASSAILTTDTVPKRATATADLAKGRVTVSGFAKGSGMIHPNMATMLAVLTTDAAIEPARLNALLHAAVDASFNRISVDGDQSTNDTVLALASGVSRARVGAADEPALLAALTAVCVALAQQIARDGEGASRLVEVTVTGAPDGAAAHRVADAIARSSLVKTAIHGGDPNWGRVFAAAGSCGVPLAPERLALAFGPPGDAIVVARDGCRTAHDAADASARLRRDVVHLALDLGDGDARCTVWTCDLSAEYVAINAHYTT
jgi:glutamate N-acetyltransferase / amino-acid N-acetyltransferase